MGVAASTDGHSLPIASLSRAVSVLTMPCRTPPRLWLPGSTTITFVPSISNWLCTRPLALWPIETMAVTAAIPMTTPRIVSPARILFLANARQAMRRMSRAFME